MVGSLNVGTLGADEITQDGCIAASIYQTLPQLILIGIYPSTQTFNLGVDGLEAIVELSQRR
jgi:hypothetical protein